ncbi:hypothetical protein ABFS82_14G027700 [Erythranthe guttata]|uniref:Uncharacterized protein n=1 Tax=Erythranthe guttata TaxID=4155 RepID=A0A022QXG0_ERYGU|nr:PREDICTED: uncharacterized protein LOC105963068 [Erythranthe guttata]EYU32576.1 hypothetical protein MIMGU_mgv1a017067mg [Erythranthe guttata]|eukprot:XP_012842888.1 PREDICTED: uncharacterized protein LOC105963068 [Erythranthe guttata]
MDINIDAISGSMNSILESPKVMIMEESESDVEDESRALLQSENGGLSKKSEKPKRKVQWLDRSGDNKLAEILEFQPSDVSDSEEEDSDSCICRIM